MTLQFSILKLSNKPLFMLNTVTNELKFLEALSSLNGELE